MARSVLIVRLGALGDLVHAMPAVAALRAAWPEAIIDWLVDGRYAALLELVPGVNRIVVIGGRTGRPVRSVIRDLRRARYDLAIDFQGLLKSAALARFAGARETAGFAAGQLREPLAGVFYTRRIPADDSGHVVRKNLSLVEALGAGVREVAAPLKVTASAVPGQVRQLLRIEADARFAVINPGAGWPNKQWPAGRYGAIAAHLRARHELPSIVTWGPREQALAGEVAAASDGAAKVAPSTSIADLVELVRAAAVFIAGDTGPMQLAAAVGTPVVGLFGPTNPLRNGPWNAADTWVSRFDQCECHHKRRCRRDTPCVNTITVEQVADAVDRRFGGGGSRA
ncbi:MAG: glycosyltransferase family 9 protein [Vicinamibacterales bacterium]|jgi:lipopolysaccharide heptosyltransferase I|nr:glycosyltransferase family 9 protein [Vicinamibacterales bacterium]